MVVIIIVHVGNFVKFIYEIIMQNNEVYYLKLSVKAEIVNIGEHTEICWIPISVNLCGGSV